MIIDKIENLGLYFAGSEWNTIADFLANLDKDTPEGEYVIRQNEIFARVMSYETLNQDKGTLEAHREYIDIQTVLIGAEGIAWHPSESLEISQLYDDEKDVEFYLTPESLPARVDVTPGNFVALFPHDAHMPQLRVHGFQSRVKKIVVKIHMTLYKGKELHVAE